MGFDEHKVNLEILKKKDNYYVIDDKHEHITPEKGIVILDKYTTIKKIEGVKQELNDAWNKIDAKVQRLGLLSKFNKKKEEDVEEPKEEYRG